MFAHPSRKLGILVVAVAVLWVTHSYTLRADPIPTECNDQKAVYIGCPIPQQSCQSTGCGNILNPCEICWSVQPNGVLSDYFDCGEPDFNDWLAHKTWLCYLVTDPLGPVMRDCLKIYYCKDNGIICVPDTMNPDTLTRQKRGTTNNCIPPV